MKSDRHIELTISIVCAGILLLVPPLTGVFDSVALTLGIPLVVIYIFGVWLVLIAASGFISARLRNSR